MRNRAQDFLNNHPSAYHWIAALSMLAVIIISKLGYIDQFKNALNSPAFTIAIGNHSINLVSILKKAIDITLLLWISHFFLKFGEEKLQSISSITGNNRTLLIKAFQCLSYFIMLLIGLDMLGIDLMALSVLGGAVSIGVGFGSKKIVSNFISGLILLFEKTIEEGDLIELNDGTIGIIKLTSARYTLIETYDSREIMIPNEDFMANRITNWTHSNNKSRLCVKIGVAYDTDLELARDVMLRAASEHTRCSKRKAPTCFISEFGESSINFHLYFWVEDITKGSRATKSDVLFSIWNKFKQHGIIIPFPQREITVLSSNHDKTQTGNIPI